MMCQIFMMCINLCLPYDIIGLHKFKRYHMSSSYALSKGHVSSFCTSTKLGINFVCSS